MPNTPFRQQNVMETRRREVERVDEMLVKVYFVHGKILVEGTGEATVDVNFPVLFTEMPNLSHGWSLDEDSNQFATTGEFPTVNVGAVTWAKEGVTDGFRGYYRAATLGLIITGKEDQKLWVHWTMVAKALRNPRNTMGDLDQEL